MAIKQNVKNCVSCYTVLGSNLITSYKLRNKITFFNDVVIISLHIISSNSNVIKLLYKSNLHKVTRYFENNA